MECSSRRPLIIVSVIFVVLIVIVGVVVWKVTKDATESDDKDLAKGDRPTDVLASTTTITPAETTPSEEELRKHPWKRLLLPRNILPVHYDVSIYPNFHGDGDMFFGNETIELNLTSPSKFIMIHVYTDVMNVTSSQIKDNETGDDIPIQRSFSYKPHEFFVIETKAEMTRPVRVMLQFEGSLVKSIVGLYKSTYYDTKTKETKYLVSSKFEPTYARRAFPCLDEPNMKAEYTVTLIHTPDYFALSNMPEVEKVQWSNELKATRFQRSVKMSTYLVCFIVCKFSRLTATSANNIPIGVYAPSDRIDQADYALAVAKHSLDKYENVFKIKYPLPKLDLIGIPDFVSGAMEHWGLITFRESALLYSETKAPLKSKERVIQVVCHEMAHQWFGNIVTMEWWNDLWLNEGFASYMEYLCVDSMEPTWNYNDLFLAFDTLRVLGDDALTSTHPIVVPVKNPDEITSVFDAISYSKGSAVIRMLEKSMGSSKFFKGITNYLNEFAWDNAKTDDLWETLNKMDQNFNVKKVMDTWTRQDGFPYINISLTTSDDGKTTVKASQKRFLSDSDAANNPENNKNKWYVSLYYTTAVGGNGSKIMDIVPDIEFIGDFGLAQDQHNWIKFNSQKVGFYRVLYPDDMWKRFAGYLDSTPSDKWTLATVDRADLLADAFSFAASGFVSYEIPLTLSSYLSSETQYLPWKVAVNYGMLYISDMLGGTADYELWKKFLVDQVRPVIQRLKFADSGLHMERRLRSLIMNQACKYEESSTLAEVKTMFREWLDNGNSPSVNVRSPIYACGMAQFGTDADWNNVWKKYLVESSPQEKELLIYTLSKTRKPYLISGLLERARRADGIKRQDFFTVVNNVGNNIYGNQIAWDWVREHYEEFENRFTVNDRYFGRMVYQLVKDYNTAVKLAEVQEFFRKHPNEGASARYRKMAVENIESNIKWMNTARRDIVNWLNSNNKKS